MGRKRRIYWPELTGGFAFQDQILSRTREFFLTLIQTQAPSPLYDLRDSVLPKYRAAFEIEKQQGKSERETALLVGQAFLDAILQHEISGVSLSRILQEPQEVPQGLQDACIALIDWAKRSNLRGKQDKIGQSADPSALKSAILDAVWPLGVGLETILYWHFAPAGELWARRDPPGWRPALWLFTNPQLPSDPLPPIQLKSLAPWLPTSPEELEETKNLRQTAEQRCISLYGEECDDRTRALNEIVEDFQQQMKFYPSFSVVDTPDWSMQTETATEFKKRVQVAFDVWLRQHIAERKKEARSSGWIEVPGPRDPDHFE